MIVFMFPVFLGTTYIVKENGKEVGKWFENDGSDATKYLDNAASKTAPRTVAEPQKITSEQNESSEKQQAEEREKWREKQLDFGIQRGITREQLESLAQENGLHRKTKYTENDSSIGKVYWVFEYVGETKHFKHSFKVYIGEGWVVEKVLHNVEEK